jgi:calpain-13
LPSTFFSKFRIAAEGTGDKSIGCNFTKSYHLSPGTYVVVPWAKREKVKFLLRIFLKIPDSNRYRTYGILSVLFYLML